MDDAYRALARAIIKPMRRWWLRVGIWWAASASLFYVGSIGILSYSQGTLSHIQQSELLLTAAELVFFGLWLLAAWQVLRISRALIAEFLYPYPVELLRFLFRLVLKHTLPLVLILALYYMAIVIYEYAQFSPGCPIELILKQLPERLVSSATYQATAHAGAIVLMVWLSALMIILPAKQWLAALQQHVAHQRQPVLPGSRCSHCSTQPFAAIDCHGQRHHGRDSAAAEVSGDSPGWS